MTKLDANMGSARQTVNDGNEGIKAHPVVAQLPPNSLVGVGQLPAEAEPSDSQELKQGCGQGQVDPDHPMEQSITIDVCGNYKNGGTPAGMPVVSAAPPGDREYALPAGGALHGDENKDEHQETSESDETMGCEHPVVAQLPQTSPVGVGQLPAEDAETRTASQLFAQLEIQRAVVAKLPLSDQFARTLEYDMAVKEFNHIDKLLQRAIARELFEVNLAYLVYEIRPPDCMSTIFVEGNRLVSSIRMAGLCLQEDQ